MKDAIKDAEKKVKRGNLGNYKYLHFAMVVDGHKMLPISSCSLGGGKHICGERLTSSHAEINALKSVRYDKLKDPKKAGKLEIVVIRLGAPELLKRTFLLLDSKPCYHCLTIMKKWGIDKVQYSCSGMTTLMKGSVSDLLKAGNFSISKGHRTRKSKGTDGSLTPP